MESKTLPKGRIVVAEDDRFYRQILAKRLAAEGHDVVLTQHGEEAWAAILDDPPELLLTDWMMPELDGHKLCRRMKDHDTLHTVYCILLTAKDRVEDKVAALDAGADDYLLKPCDDSELLARVRAGLRQHRTWFRLAAATVTDPLTGVGNRRLFDQRLREECMRADRYDTPLSLVLIDIDQFKAINDTYGHPAGDAVLRRIGELLACELRTGEAVARIGGDEFAALLPNADGEDAERVAARIEGIACTHPIDLPDGTKIVVRVAAGAASLQSNQDPLSLVENADKALYKRKRTKQKSASA